MKMKRSEALQAHQGLLALEKGQNGQPFDLAWDTWDKIFKMVASLAPVTDAYAKARQQRFLAVSGNKPEMKDGSEQVMEFQKQEEEKLGETISVTMPKTLLTDADLKLSQNKIPPSIRMQLKAVVVSDKPEMDGDENEY